MASEASSSQAKGKGLADDELVATPSSPLPEGPQQHGVSHVYIPYPPLNFSIPHAEGVMYDDGNRLLLVPAAGKVHAWSVSSFHSGSGSSKESLPVSGEPTPQATPRPPETSDVPKPLVHDIGEGPVLAIRYSLDCRTIAVQRSPFEVEFINCQGGIRFRQRCKRSSSGGFGSALAMLGTQPDHILGFFWTDCSTCDVIFITTGGLELYALLTGRHGLRLVDWKKKPVSWYVYTHESRLLVLASGPQCRTLTSYQFSPNGTVKLPKFEAVLEAPGRGFKPELPPEDLRIATMYGRLYCVQLDRIGRKVQVFQFYRDAVIPQPSIELFSDNVAVSVVDNVLLLHQLDTQVVLLYDVMSGSLAPITAPLPLTLRGAPPGGADVSSEPSATATDAGTGDGAAPNDRLGNAAAGPRSTTELYPSSWIFMNPDLILDHDRGLLWRLHVDLAVMAATMSDPYDLLSFLQRRKYSGALQARQLSMDVIRSLVYERAPLPTIAAALDIATSAFALAVRAAVGVPKRPRTSSSRVRSAMAASAAATRYAAATGAGVTAATSLGGAQSATAAVAAKSSASEQARGSSERSWEGSGAAAGSGEGGEGAEREAGSDERTAGSTSESKGSAKGGGGSAAGSAAGSSQIRALRGGLAEASADVVSPPAICPEDIFFNILIPAREERRVDSSFLIPVILEFIRSTSAVGIHMATAPALLVIELLLQDGRLDELRQLLQSHALDLSAPTAMMLLRNANSRAMGLDALRLLHMHHDYVLQLVQDGDLIGALRYMRQHSVENVAPGLFLEQAVKLDSQKLATILRFCGDFVPNFLESRSYQEYAKFLQRPGNATTPSG